jgi:hypothetical protein
MRTYDNNKTIDESVHSLRKDIELLAERLASLEANLGGTAASISRPMNSDHTPLRSGLRSAIWGKGRN